MGIRPVGWIGPAHEMQAPKGMGSLCRRCGNLEGLIPYKPGNGS